MLITYFLIFSLIFVLAVICFIKIAYFSIQPNQWFDQLFHWQNRLDSWYQSKSKGKQYLAKAGGDCPLCFSNFLAFISYFVYYFFMIRITGAWITDLAVFEHNWRGDITFWGLNVIWYVIYMSLTVVGSTLFISAGEK